MTRFKPKALTDRDRLLLRSKGIILLSEDPLELRLELEGGGTSVFRTVNGKIDTNFNPDDFTPAWVQTYKANGPLAELLIAGLQLTDKLERHAVNPGGKFPYAGWADHQD